jgi:hypothetical protein
MVFRDNASKGRRGTEQMFLCSAGKVVLFIIDRSLKTSKFSKTWVEGGAKYGFFRKIPQMEDEIQLRKYFDL